MKTLNLTKRDLFLVHELPFFPLSSFFVDSPFNCRKRYVLGLNTLFSRILQNQKSVVAEYAPGFNLNRFHYKMWRNG